MAITLTVGTNTYISLADAESYFETRYNSTSWDDITDDEVKKSVLVQATRSIDYQRLAGRKYDTSQTLQFPRSYDTSSDIPTRVENAVCEEAIAILEQNYNTFKLQKDGLQSKRVGDAQEVYNTNSSGYNPGSALSKRLLSVDAMQMLQLDILRTVRFL